MHAHPGRHDAGVIHTISGRRINTEAPSAEAIELTDIAHHLSIIALFHGSTVRPYSLAEHSLLMVEILERDEGMNDPSGLLAALLHYAHAAYLGDPDLPSVRYGGAGFEALQTRLQYAALKGYELRAAAAGYAVAIHRADLSARATARRDLTHSGLDAALPIDETESAVDWMSLRSHDGMTWQDWRQAFTERAEGLQWARRLRFSPS